MDFPAEALETYNHNEKKKKKVNNSPIYQHSIQTAFRIQLTLYIWHQNCVGRFCKQLVTKVTLLMAAILLNSVGLVLCLEIPERKVSYILSSNNQEMNGLT